MIKFTKTKKLYDCKTVENLIGRYAALNGVTYEIEEGCLGYGLTVCAGEGLRTAVIKEVQVNTQYSLHSIRFYNVMPEKYRKALEKIGA